MDDLRQYMNVLGRKVKDKVTGYEGVCVGVHFDLPGCIQCSVKTTGVDKDGKLFEGYWFDHNRLTILDDTPVVPLSSYRQTETDRSYSKGPIDKPTQRG